MSITSLFDVLLAHEGAAGTTSESVTSGRSEADTLSALADQMVSSSLASGQTLREFRERMFPAEVTPSTLEIAKALREDFLKWIADAEVALRRASQLKQMGHPEPARAPELNDMVGMTEAMLKITPEAHRESLEQVRRGETYSLGEIRRELQLKHQC